MEMQHTACFIGLSMSESEALLQRSLVAAAAAAVVTECLRL